MFFGGNSILFLSPCFYGRLLRKEPTFAVTASKNKLLEEEAKDSKQNCLGHKSRKFSLVAFGIFFLSLSQGLDLLCCTFVAVPLVVHFFFQNKHKVTGNGSVEGKKYMGFVRANMDQIQKKITDDLWVLSSMEVRKDL